MEDDASFSPHSTERQLTVANKRPRVWDAYTRLVLADNIAQHGWEIGDHTYGTPNVGEPGYGHLRIGKYCSISSGVNIVLANHLTHASTTYPFVALRAFWASADASISDHEAGSVEIGNDVWIGLNACILAGTTISDGCIIGAGAVVRGYIPPYSVVVGNPAKVIKQRFSKSVVGQFLRVNWWDLPDDVVDALIPKLLASDPTDFLNAAEEARRVHGNAKAVLKSDFVACTKLWGKFESHEHDPRIHEVQLVSWFPGLEGGMFTADGEAVSGTIDYHGPNRSSASQLLRMNSSMTHPVECAEDLDYVYGGTINPHYGHFLVNTLPRLWFICRNGLGLRKIICRATVRPADWLKLPFIAEIFGYLGLKEDDFVHFEHQVKLCRITIPHSSFEEQHYVHRVFGEMCRMIGTAVLSGADITVCRRPVYLPKTNLTMGVGRIVNEKEIVQLLKKVGFDIIFPEQLTFTEQVKLFATREFICGSVGSAFHTSVFSDSAARIVIVNTIPDINSNFVLLDSLGTNNTRYFFPSDTKVIHLRDDPFITSFRVANPQRVALEIIRIWSQGAQGNDLVPDVPVIEVNNEA